MKLLPSILGVAFAFVLSTGEASFGGQTADACITKPGSSGPKGTHWYYRINRADGRHCWYLGSQAGQTAAQPRLAAWESPSPLLQPTTDASSQQAAPMTAPQIVAAAPTLDVTAMDFAKRWPAVPMPTDLVSAAERRAAEDAKEQTPAAEPILESKQAELVPDSDKAGMGPITFVGAVAMLSLLLVGGILKLAGYLENRLRLAHGRSDGRFGSQIVSAPVESAGPKPAERVPEARIVRRAPTPTDPAQDLKASLRELMQDLRRADAAANARMSFEPAPRPKARLRSGVRPLLAS